MSCSKCDKISNTNSTRLKCLNCIDDCLICDKNKKPLSYGWICPKCGRVNAPFSSSCPCVVIKYEITC